MKSEVFLSILIIYEFYDKVLVVFMYVYWRGFLDEVGIWGYLFRDKKFYEFGIFML